MTDWTESRPRPGTRPRQKCNGSVRRISWFARRQVRAAAGIAFLAVVTAGVPADAGTAPGAPAPVPYRAIADPPPEAERHIIVKAEDRGPVWLLTGFLHGFHPDIPYETIAALKPTYWRGGWPFWSGPYNAAGASPVRFAQYLDTRMRLQADTGLAWQVLLAFKSGWTPKGAGRVPWAERGDYREHIRTLVGYCEHMGVPVDYWEVWNEAPPGPYEGAVPGHFWRGTWAEWLGAWDATYDAVREVNSKARIAGPSYGFADTANIRSFLDHCRDKGQRLDVLDWHDGCHRQGPEGSYRAPLDQVHKNIDEIRSLVAAEYPMLGVKEIHISEWGRSIGETGVGTEIAFFHYLDLAGVDRAARAVWTENDLCGLLVGPRTPRTTYWAWKAYADGTGVRLVTETNDRSLVAIASRDDERGTVRVLVARSKRYTTANKPLNLPPVTVRLDVAGVPTPGEAEVSILRLGPGVGPLWEEDLPGLTEKKVVSVRDGAVTLVLADVLENEVRAVTIAPGGSWALAAARRQWQETQRRLAAAAVRGERLPTVLLREGFESGYEPGETVLGRQGWTQGAKQVSATTAVQDDGAHSGNGYARFSGNYWADHEIVHRIPLRSRGTLEATAWMRFSEYEGNRNGKGFAQLLFGLLDSAGRDGNKNRVTFQFGTNEQVSYARFNFISAGSRGISRVDPSRLIDDVRGAWYQVGILIDMESRTVTARHRRTAQDDWIVYCSERYDRMDWAPQYVMITAYNQAPDWRLCVDDIEVTSSVGEAAAAAP